MEKDKRQSKSLVEIVKLAFPGLSDEDVLKLQRGVPPWDSMGHIILLEVIESEMSIHIDIGFSIRVRDWPTLQNELSGSHRR